MTLARVHVLVPLLVTALTTACAPPAATQASLSPSLSGQPSPTQTPNMASPSASATATASLSASPATYANATLGYRVVLPAGYRASSCSSWVDVGMDRMGIDFFTPLSDLEERELNVGDIPPAERASDFSVSAYRNADGTSALDWARTRPENRGSTVDAMTIGGREGARIVTTDGMRAVSYAVRADGRIYSIVADIRREGADTERFLGTIAASLEPITPGPFPTPSTKAPRDAAQELATVLAKAFGERDAAAVAIRMRGCTLGMYAMVEMPEPNNTCCILNRAISPFIEALRSALAGGTVTVVVDPVIRSIGQGGTERFFAVSRWTENGKTRQIDLLFDERGGQWYWSGAIHHFQLMDRPVCYGRMWGGTYQGPPC